MTVEGLPDPVCAAGDRTALALAFVDAVLPPAGTWIQLWMKRRLEAHMTILAEEVSKRGIASLDELTDGQREYVLPQAYRFAEQIRIGEYEHNLRVLAKVISSDLDETGPGRSTKDTGRALRIARKLEGLEYEGLVALALSASLLSEHSMQSGLEDYISPSQLVVEVREYGIDADEKRCDDIMFDLASRGLLRVAEGLMFGRGYCENQAFVEVIEAARAVVSDAHKDANPRD